MDVSWDEYHQLIELLADRIHSSGWEFDRVACLSRGGLRVGDILSRIFDRPLAILAARSYQGVDQQQRGRLEIAAQLTFTGELGDRILLVDDLVDSGQTLQQSASWLLVKHPSIKQIKTAVIWHKLNSSYIPDHCGAVADAVSWINQPFERSDRYELGSCRQEAVG